MAKKVAAKKKAGKKKPVPMDPKMAPGQNPFAKLAEKKKTKKKAPKKK